MTNIRIDHQYLEVKRLLDSRRISKAISIVRDMLETAHLNSLVLDLQHITETYGYLTEYLLNGYKDQGRDKMLSEISASLLSMADMAVRESLASDSSEYYYESLRFNRLRDENIPELLSEYGSVSSEMSLAEAVGDVSRELRRKKEELLDRLFVTIFTSLHTDSGYKDISKYLVSGYADDSVASLSISALTLSLLFYYDKAKFNTLLDIYETSASTRDSARALVGIVIAMIPNRQRIESDSSMMARFSMLEDSESSYTQLLEVIKAMIGTRDTERVSTKLKDEVIPELMKMRPEIMKAIRENMLDPESAAENNPEWEELLNKSSLGEKMRELSEMQSSGADLMMVTFSNLKQFPFFYKASNWFLPFNPNHTDLNLSEEMKEIISKLMQMGAMICDSDIYSLALAANHLPAQQISMMSKQISDNYEQLSEEAKTDLQNTLAPDFNKEVLKAVRDFYRFFKLFRKKSGFFDPFSTPLHFLELPMIGKMLSSEEVLGTFSEFYFRRGYYGDALPLFLALENSKGDDHVLWQKIGFCYQSNGEFQEALKAYERSALLSSPGPWLVKKIAFVSRCLGMHEKAANYYLKALEMDPDNVSLMLNAGSMLLETGRIGEALNQFHHANYLSQDNAKVLRAIAWAELLSGNLDKSEEYYARIIAIEPLASDYLNAGHVAFLHGNNREALNFYRLSLAKDENSFETSFRKDMKVLSDLPDYDITAHGLLLDLTLS